MQFHKISISSFTPSSYQLFKVKDLNEEMIVFQHRNMNILIKLWIHLNNAVYCILPLKPY